ncbi:ATP-binding protein [Streptomyces sparsogenes]|uniref:ATP-binding protein n=1 Tax=Streptomyces sparsogenes TaxID=67365 RepID=UPI0033EF6B45
MSQATCGAAPSDARPPEARDHSFPLPRIPQAVSVVRRRARAVLTDWHVPRSTAEDALLVVSELVTNAIDHALAPAFLRLAWIGDGAEYFLRVEVTDAGPAPRAPHADPEEHGRGTLIVAALSARHGSRAHLGGITRWADLRAW